MTIGEQIIAEIGKRGDMLNLKDHRGDSFDFPILIVWNPDAKAKLDALVSAHVEAEVKRRTKVLNDALMLAALDGAEFKEEAEDYVQFYVKKATLSNLPTA